MASDVNTLNNNTLNILNENNNVNNEKFYQVDNNTIVTNQDELDKTQFFDVFSTKDDLKIVVDFMLFFYYDILNLKFKRDLVYFGKYEDELDKVNNENSIESINYKLEVLEKIKQRLSSNSNIKMVLDKLIIEFSKEI